MAVVLRKYSQGDLDGRYIFLTERFGKVSAKAKSSRKITSKLAPHLEPGTVTKVRFIENHHIQVIDALKERRSPVSLADLHFLSQLLHDFQPEPELWGMLAKGFSWPRALAVLGWDPEEAACMACGRMRPEYFSVARQEFLCGVCARKLPLKLRVNALLSIYGV